MSPTTMAMAASESSGDFRSRTYSEISGTVIQASAARTKTARTLASGALMRPRRASSVAIRSRPPGTSSISGRNSTRVSRNQHAKSSTTAIGTPTSIHWPKPISTPCSAAMWPASRVLGGVPMMVPSEPMDAAYAMPSMSAVPKFDFVRERISACVGASPAADAGAAGRSTWSAPSSAVRAPSVP